MRDRAEVRVLIEGHCDERGTVEYNLALGERRAAAARDYVVNAGIDISRIDIISYGEERPFATGTGEDVWQLNRRAHFVEQ
jgi:peptidoglycan-associated lipoprotein